MSVLGKDVAAVFFISRERPAAALSLEELLRTSGATELRPDSHVEGLLACDWAGLHCLGAVVEHTDYRQLWLSFPQGDLLDRLYPRPEDDRLEAEPGLSLVYAFRDACDALQVDAGMLLTQNWQAEQEWVDSHEWAVLAFSNAHLRYQGIRLLYLDEERVSGEPPHPVLDAHDQLPARRGRLYFGGSGRHRLG